MSEHNSEKSVPRSDESSEQGVLARRSFLAGAGGIAALGASGVILPALTGAVGSAAAATPSPGDGTTARRYRYAHG
jgi:hypothetical protein